jgi:hypothetical protein
MVTKKQNEAMLYLIHNQPHTYLAKFFKMIYFFELDTRRQTGSNFFKTDFVADSIAPIPTEIWNNLGNEKLMIKYPDCWELDIPPGKKFNFRNIKDFKITALRQADLTEFGPAEVTRMDKLIEVYGNKTPSQMFEKTIFPKQVLKTMIEEGKQGSLIDMDWIYQKGNSK